MKKKYILILAPFIIFGLLAFSAPVKRYFTIAKYLEIFATVFRQINLAHINEINPGETLQKGIKSMLEMLDPYTDFIAEDKVEDYRILNTGQYGGIGATTRFIEGQLIVTMLYEGYPAAKNGLKIGDEIVQIEETTISNTSYEEAGQLMRGQVGTPVHLIVKRIGIPDALPLSFVRKKIKINNVPYFGMIQEHIGYIRLINFMEDAGEEVKNALVDLKKKNPRGIIIDLRGNPGGLLIEAVNICNLFLPKNAIIVTTKGKTKNSNGVYKTRENPIDTAIPLIVLINEKSASASEIIAGSFQDYDRAVIVGKKSFGKGLVQINRSLPYNAQIKITTAKYYTPSGRCIQALDYQQYGTVNKIPDSLKKEFKTMHGRSVYAGGGVMPDVQAPLPKPSSFGRMLSQKGFILAYTAAYANRHTRIAPATAFQLDNEAYNTFMQWMKTQKYTYRSPAEKALNQLKETAKKEQCTHRIDSLADRIKHKLQKTNSQQLLIHKKEIKKMLEESIVSYYYFEKGKMQTSLQQDPGIAESVDILNDSLRYAKIINTP